MLCDTELPLYLVVLVGSQFSYQDLIIWFQVSTVQGKNRILNCTKYTPASGFVGAGSVHAVLDVAKNCEFSISDGVV